MGAPEARVRRLPARVAFALLWLVVIRVVSGAVIGGILGALASSGAGSFDAGYDQGRAASIAFFARYGWLILLAQLGVWAVLSYRGWLPGTGRLRATPPRGA